MQQQQLLQMPPPVATHMRTASLGSSASQFLNQLRLHDVLSGGPDDTGGLAVDQSALLLDQQQHAITQSTGSKRAHHSSSSSKEVLALDSGVPAAGKQHGGFAPALPAVEEDASQLPSDG